MGVKYGDQVKKPLLELSYTDDMIMELSKCEDDIWYFLKYVKIVHPDKGVITFEPYDFQKKILKNLQTARFNVALCSRQAGKTTIVSTYALWYAIFHPDKTIGIASNKQVSALDIMHRIKRTYEDLPLWLKPGIVEYSKSFVTFDNGTKIMCSATSEDAFRGRTLNLLIMDEYAFIPANISFAFWAANYPTISASQDAKIIIISCVSGDTYIFSDKGPKQVKEYLMKGKNGAYEIKNYNISGKNTVNNGNIFVDSGYVDTKIIETTSSKLEGSLNHKLWACKNGIYDWYKMCDLSVGDFISIQYGMNLWGNNDTINYKMTETNLKCRWGGVVKRDLQECKKLDIEKITPDWAYLFGLYISEGYADSHRLCITCGDDVSSIFDKLNLKWYKQDEFHYYISSLAVIELLKFVGFDITKKATEKVIPQRLLEMSKENIISMLKGIFDGDGWSRKDRGTVGIGLSSAKLIEQIRMLLLNFGILTDYYVHSETIESSKGKVKSNSTQYRISCSINESRKFYDIIGFNFKRKQDKKQFLPLKYNETKKDIIPFANLYLKEYTKVLRKTHPINRKPNIEHLSKTFIVKIIGWLKEKGIKLNKEIEFILNNCISDTIKWERIKSIKDSKNNVYDFSLPEIKDDKWCHSVIYNGFVGHQTPNGLFNQFHTIYSQAERKENGFLSFKSDWRDVPGRDDKWAEEQKANIGQIRFNQEYAVEFLGSTNTVITPDIIEYLYTQYIEPSFTEMNGKFRIYEKPIKGCTYVIGCDVAKGTGEHYSVSQVLKLITTRPLSFEQVAVFEDNFTDVYSFADIINRISLYYNGAHLMVENNAEGAAIVNRLWWDLENERLVNSGNKATDLGIRATKTSKPRAVLLMKKLIEDNCLILKDKRTIDQLAVFIEENGRFFGKDLADDCVSGLYWACYSIFFDLFDTSVELKSSMEVNDEHTEEEVWGILSDISDAVEDWSWINNWNITDR